MDLIGYLKSILEDSKPYTRMKLMLVGVQGIGKTSLLEKLREEGTGSYKKKPPEVRPIQLFFSEPFYKNGLYILPSVITVIF